MGQKSSKLKSRIHQQGHHELDQSPPQISAAEFYSRFTDVEKAAIWTATSANPALGVGFIRGLAVGTIDLTSAELHAWMDGLVLRLVRLPPPASQQTAALPGYNRLSLE
jgi:hypothetical protein